MTPWSTLPLKEVGAWYGGGTPSKARADFWSGGNVPWVSPKDMTGEVLQDSRDHITVAAVEGSSVRLVPAGSVAVVVRSGILERTLPIALVPFETTFNQDMKAVVPRDDIDPRWVAWALRAEEHNLLATTRKAGTTVASLETTELLKHQIPLAPLDEQRQIVEILEDHLSRLDAADRLLTNSTRRSKAMTKSVLISLIPDESQYPSEWKRASVAEAGRVELGRQRHPDWHHGPNMRPYLRVANVFEDRIDTSDVMEMHWPDNTFDRFKLHTNDVLLNEGQSPHLLGRPAIYRGEPPNVAFTNSLLRFIAGPEVLPEFALLVFRRHMHAGRFARESRITTNIAHLSARRLKDVEFPIPSLAEQQALVDHAREVLASVERLNLGIEQESARSTQLRRAVLAAAFSGRLTGRRTDDEHIEELAEAMG